MIGTQEVVIANVFISRLV